MAATEIGSYGAAGPTTEAGSGTSIIWQRVRVSAPATLTGVEVQMAAGQTGNRVWYAMVFSDAGSSLATGAPTPVPGPSTPTILPVSYALADTADYRIQINSSPGGSVNDVGSVGCRPVPVTRTGLLVTPAAGERLVIGGSIVAGYQMCFRLMGPDAGPVVPTIGQILAPQQSERGNYRADVAPLEPLGADMSEPEPEPREHPEAADGDNDKADEDDDAGNSS